MQTTKKSAKIHMERWESGYQDGLRIAVALLIKFKGMKPFEARNLVLSQVPNFTKEVYHKETTLEIILKGVYTQGIPPEKKISEEKHFRQQLSERGSGMAKKWEQYANDGTYVELISQVKEYLHIPIGDSKTNNGAEKANSQQVQLPTSSQINMIEIEGGKVRIHFH